MSPVQIVRTPTGIHTRVVGENGEILAHSEELETFEAAVVNTNALLRAFSIASGQAHMFNVHLDAYQVEVVDER